MDRTTPKDYGRWDATCIKLTSKPKQAKKEPTKKKTAVKKGKKNG